jgi:hypothetical protein
MRESRKNNLLARLIEDIPPVDKSLRAHVESWLREDDVPTLWRKLQEAMPRL